MKGEPIISFSSENILMRSFESEKLELKCVVESYPKPNIHWLRNNQIISDLNESNYFPFDNNIFEMKNEFESLCKMIAILEFPINSEYIFANYSCIANNSIGKTSKTFLIEGFIIINVIISQIIIDFLFFQFSEENILSDLRKKFKRFNITGFIIGMCPPILISFYIIIKLGYRSRYAQERTDDTGANEEPFFVSN